MVDPLDGTVNFLHGFWAVGVSVALVEEGRPVAGAVHAPFLGTTWTASRGEAARRKRVGDGPASTDPGLASGRSTGPWSAQAFPSATRSWSLGTSEAFRAAFGRFEDLRRPGAAALDLAWVADGTFDGFFELSLGAGTWRPAPC